MRYLLILLACAGLFAPPARALDLHGIPPGALALWVAPVESDRVDLAYRADEPVSPASTMKLVTAWAALERLGPDFTWQTRLVSEAPVVDGVLKGDLYWVGQGDPRFYSEQLLELLRRLRQRGVHAIAGRLLLDGSAYSRLSSAAGFLHDEGANFMAPPDPLLTNLNVTWLRFFHDAAGVRALLDPPLDGITLDARLTDAGPGRCGDVRSHLALEQDGNRIRVRGALPDGCDGTSMYLQPLAPDAFEGAVFAGLWHQLGGSGPVAAGRGKAPATGVELASVTSPTLSRILPDINKFSSNPMARSLYLTLGRMAPDSGDTVQDAERAVRQTLAAHHLPDRPLVLENGSGLSLRERVSASLLGRILREAARGPYASELMASLPVASQSGTLSHRLADPGPRLRLKTGTLDSVAALAGYWQAPDGQRLVIVALVNHRDAARFKPALDAVVRDAVRQFGAGGI